MANRSSNSSRVTPTTTTTTTTTATTTTTTTAGTTTTTTGHVTTNNAGSPLNRDLLARVLVYIDKFSTLHAMAATCKGWNENCSTVFEWLRKIGSVRSSKTCWEHCQEMYPLPASKAVSFAVEYVCGRLRSGNDEPEMRKAFTHGVVNLIRRQPADQRIHTANRTIHYFEDLSSDDWKRLLHLVRKGTKSEFHFEQTRSSFRQVLEDDHGKSVHTQITEMTVNCNNDVDRVASGFKALVRQFENENPEHLDALFEEMVTNFNHSPRAAVAHLLSDPDFVISGDTALRWLRLEPPSDICTKLLHKLLASGVPQRYEARVLLWISRTVMPEAGIEGTTLLSKFCDSQDFDRVAASNRKALKKLVRNLNEMLDNPRRSDRSVVVNFFEKLVAQKIVSADEFRAWTGQH